MSANVAAREKLKKIIANKGYRRCSCLKYSINASYVKEETTGNLNTGIVDIHVHQKIKGETEKLNIL